jgi:catechol 2,3-dioxygenase-like lactoylglutathione lyase family enzyme
MDWSLELVVVPVSDVDRAKAFYIGNVGFVELVDTSVGDKFRVVQLTPPGSACAIAIGTFEQGAPGSLKGLHLCVPDIEAAREELVGRGTEVGEFFHFEPSGRTPGLDPERSSYNSFFAFADPDGNGWLVQEVTR